MNVEAAKEAARVYYNYEPGERWDDVWRRDVDEEDRRLWYDVTKAVEPFCEPQDAPQGNNSMGVDQESINAAAILRLAAEVEDLKRRLSASEAWTKPIGDAKVGVQDLLSKAQRAGEIAGTIAGTATKKKGFW